MKSCEKMKSKLYRLMFNRFIQNRKKFTITLTLFVFSLVLTQMFLVNALLLALLGLKMNMTSICLCVCISVLITAYQTHKIVNKLNLTYYHKFIN